MVCMRMPETCWAVFKWQVINLRVCCIWLVDSVESMVMHGLANPKTNTDVSLYGVECDTKQFVLEYYCSLCWGILYFGIHLPHPKFYKTAIFKSYLTGVIDFQYEETEASFGSVIVTVCSHWDTGMKMRTRKEVEVLSRNTNKTQLCNRIYYSKVYWRLNMFQEVHRSSSGALNCSQAKPKNWGRRLTWSASRRLPVC
jgi:hypothetical protein